jgi:hypothetical protein
MLNCLQPSQLIYCDTDSVIFLYDKTNEHHKYPTNDDKTKPTNIRFGDALGEWENEFGHGEWIDEIVVGGAKSYSYRTNKGKITIKQKGITLDRANSNVFTFDNVRNTILNQIPKETPHLILRYASEGGIFSSSTSRSILLITTVMVIF